MKILYVRTWLMRYDTYQKDECPKTEYGFYTLKSLIEMGGVISPLCLDGKTKLKNWIRRRLIHSSEVEVQFNILRKTKDYDVIYIGSDLHLLPIAILKAIGLCRTPVFVVSHFCYNSNYTRKWWKKIYIRIERYFVFKYIDRLSFASEYLMRMAEECGRLPNKHKYVCNWGAPLDFYNKKLYTEEPTRDFFMAAGMMRRDYYTLIQAVKACNSIQLRIFAKELPEYTKGEGLPENVRFEDLRTGRTFVESYKLLRDNYYNCIAVLLPIAYLNDVPNGATVLTEALAMGKPIVITRADTNYIDVEKEGCGLTVESHDVAGWVDAINYLSDNPDKAIEMGRRSYELAVTKYNDENFSRTIYAQMKDLTGKE